ncbi:hypothetical protein PLICRDRAFT_34876 [Plicaturopsis crispa FD-325 SS-3]|nr:hypothetical protein PLICRDRAFT_34876 [Plicaturopsis crispa FD-325 SS-3]
MCHRFDTKRPLFSDDSNGPSLKGKTDVAPSLADSAYRDWLASRVTSSHGKLLAAGSHRRLSAENSILAYRITRNCALDLFWLLWGLHPARTTLMMSLNVLRGLFPAFKGYSQAMIINELQALVASGQFTWARLVRLMITEVSRRLLECLIDSFATANENCVQSSARFFVEYQQMEQRVRLDIPTLTDPSIRDLLQESDLFVSSFNGMGGFGLLSPFDLVQILALLSELVSHVWVLLSLTAGGGRAQIGALALAIASSFLPLFTAWCGFAPPQPEPLFDRHEARNARQQEKMRNLAYSDTHRPEIILFGLGPWILKSWGSARKALLKSERSAPGNHLSLLSQINFSDISFALQNIPLVLILQSSSASLGSLALYRSSIQALVYTIRHLVITVRMAFQSIFLMAAFYAAMRLQPLLRPKRGAIMKYNSSPGGLKLEVKALTYTYPGCKEPSLHNVNFTVEPGETLAIVGYNGSGKSTLAKMILRILDFDAGELLINGVDIRKYDPAAYHHHVTTVFQGFSKFNCTVKENVGIGYIPNLDSRYAVETAIQLGGATALVDSLPKGLRTKLDVTGFDSAAYLSYPGDSGSETYSHTHGLSGGEWQRIAISRAFMRAENPEVDLLVFDEPTSSLDARAQKNVFDTIEQISRDSSGRRTKTVIFITHRLSTARRADKIAMMEEGTITEFGTHEDLVRRDGSYASLYRASI